MPYRVKIISPNHAEPYYWPGLGERPLDMSRTEGEQVIADCKRVDASLARYSRERGEPWQDRRYELDHVRAERPVSRHARL